MEQTPLRERFPSALRVDDLSSDDYLGYLHLEHFPERAGEPYEYVVMGDLRPAFYPNAPEDAWEPNNWDAAERLQFEIKRKERVGLEDGIVFEPEAATFFAYARTRDHAEALMDFVKEVCGR